MGLFLNKHKFGLLIEYNIARYILTGDMGATAFLTYINSLKIVDWKGAMGPLVTDWNPDLMGLGKDLDRGSRQKKYGGCKS